MYKYNNIPPTVITGIDLKGKTIEKRINVDTKVKLFESDYPIYNNAKVLFADIDGCSMIVKSITKTVKSYEVS